LPVFDIHLRRQLIYTEWCTVSALLHEEEKTRRAADTRDLCRSIYVLRGVKCGYSSSSISSSSRGSSGSISSGTRKVDDLDAIIIYRFRHCWIQF